MDVKPNLSNELFVFNDGIKSRELEIERTFIDDLPIDRLAQYLETKVIPKLIDSPDKRIRLTKSGIEVLDRTS